MSTPSEKQLEYLERAANLATTLVAALKLAHESVCADGIVNQLLHHSIVPLLNDARDLKGKIHAIHDIVKP